MRLTVTLFFFNQIFDVTPDLSCWECFFIVYFNLKHTFYYDLHIRQIRLQQVVVQVHRSLIESCLLVINRLNLKQGPRLRFSVNCIENINSFVKIKSSSSQLLTQSINLSFTFGINKAIQAAFSVFLFNLIVFQGKFRS